MGQQAALAHQSSQLSRGASMSEQQQEHVTTTEARAGATPHMTRYVLGIGLVLVIVLFAFILFAAG
jgi:hypothetical protein